MYKMCIFSISYFCIQNKYIYLKLSAHVLSTWEEMWVQNWLRVVLSVFFVRYTLREIKNIFQQRNSDHSSADHLCVSDSISPSPDVYFDNFSAVATTSVGNLKESKIRSYKIEMQKPFQCKKCGRGFALKGTISRHLKYECGLQPRFQCPYCNLISKQTSPVYAHIRRKHPGEEVYIYDLKL